MTDDDERPVHVVPTRYVPSSGRRWRPPDTISADIVPPAPEPEAGRATLRAFEAVGWLCAGILIGMAVAVRLGLT